MISVEEFYKFLVRIHIRAITEIAHVLKANGNSDYYELNRVLYDPKRDTKYKSTDKINQILSELTAHPDFAQYSKCARLFISNEIMYRRPLLLLIPELVHVSLGISARDCKNYIVSFDVIEPSRPKFEAVVSDVAFVDQLF